MNHRNTGTTTFLLLLIVWSCCWRTSFGLSIKKNDGFSQVQKRREPVGRITSLNRNKLDNVADTQFYIQPKLVTHTDEEFIKNLKQVYAERIPDDATVLDLMGSHISHWPGSGKDEDILTTFKPIKRLDVHGMNMQELEQNSIRQATNGKMWIRDLNDNPSLLGLCDCGTYDAVLCCAGIQYLEEPETALAEVARVLKPETGLVLISFTNRFFYQKALQGWIDRGMKERARLVMDYLRAAGGFEDIEIVGDGTSVWAQMKSVGGFGGDPFVVVIARRNAE